MLHTLVVHVDDKPGVLNRVASLFRRRAFNIESLTVGHTETRGVSRGRGEANLSPLPTRPLWRYVRGMPRRSVM